MTGFEPAASTSQMSRATSCATPRLVKIFNFSVKSVSGQICGQKFFAETHGGGKARKCEKNGDFESFRRSAYEAVTRSQMSRATNCATPRNILFFLRESNSEIMREKISQGVKLKNHAMLDFRKMPKGKKLQKSFGLLAVCRMFPFRREFRVGFSTARRKRQRFF